MAKKKKELSAFEKKLNDGIAKHFSRIPFLQKIFFVEHLRTMIHAGISLVESLGILKKESESRRMQMIIEEITADVEQGQQLSDVLKKHPELFPTVYTEMIAAGETSGQLEESLKQVEIQMKKTRELVSSIRGAMIYPIVVIIAMGIVGILMVTVVLPKLLVLFKEFDAELPLATRILIVITDFLANPINLTLVLGGGISFIVGFVFLLKKVYPFKRAIHNLNLHLPIFGNVIKNINLARFSLTLSSLLKSAIPIVEAMRITAQTCSNVRYQEEIMKTKEDIEKGVPISEILQKNDFLFPPIVTEMIMVGERSGEVGDLLTEIANFYGDQVDKTMKNFSTVIEPVIILVLGVAVAGIAMAVVMPMYSLVQGF